MNGIILPEVVATGIYNSQLAIKNRETTQNRKTTMFELEFPYEKGGTAYIDADAFPITADIVVCAKPGQVRHTRLPYKCYFIHMIVKEGELYNMLLKIPTYMTIGGRERYEELFRGISAYYNTGLYRDQLMLYSLILELIYRLYENAQNQEYENQIKRGSEESIGRVIEYIKSNLTADLSLAAVSEYASFSPIHFHNSFKASTGKTLREYVEEQRIQKAINLLVSTELTLAEIAYECGFSSQSYFSYAFKKRMGMTPREYAKEIIRRYES